MAENKEIEIRVVVTGEAAATALQAALEPSARALPLIIDQSGIDGAVMANLVVLATAMVQSVPAALEAIRRLVNQGSVREIEVSEGGIRMVNPRAQDVDRIIERWAGGE
jgi:hypothetical protein